MQRVAEGGEIPIASLRELADLVLRSELVAVGHPVLHGEPSRPSSASSLGVQGHESETTCPNGLPTMKHGGGSTASLPRRAKPSRLYCEHPRRIAGTKCIEPVAALFRCFGCMAMG